MKFGDNYLTSLVYDIANQNGSVGALNESAGKEEVKLINLESRNADEGIVHAQREVFRTIHAERCRAKTILGELEEELPFPEYVD